MECVVIGFLIIVTVIVLWVRQMLWNRKYR